MSDSDLKKSKTKQDLNSSKPSKKKKSARSEYIKQTSAWQVLFLFILGFTAIFLIIGRFELGGRLPVEFYKLISLAVGWTSWIVIPTLIFYLTFINYRKIKPEALVVRIISSALFVVAIAGCLHIFTESQASELAKAGSHGGYIGWGIAHLMGLFSNLIALLILLSVVTITGLLIFDVSLKDIIRLIKSFFKDKPVPSYQEFKPALKPAQKFKLDKAVPTESSDKVIQKSKKPSVKNQPVAIKSDSSWQFPPLNLLVQSQDKADAGDVQANAEIIKETLANFNIDVEMEGANVGPRVTRYTLKPPSGIKLAKIAGLESNIALDLAAASIRIEAPIPGKKAVGIEVPNKKAATVRISNLFTSSEWDNIKPRQLAFCIGQDIAGNPEIGYLTSMPHILLAGQTGSGKSVGINILLTSLLYSHSPEDLKLILVDPKQVELGLYNDIPHLLTPVITSPEKCVSALKWAVAEMERRLKIFASVSRRNIAEFNSLKDQETLPFIVIVIDELADLMMVASKDAETLIVRIAQKARAAGIHLVLATQRPSVNVITGLIKANIPARMAFSTASQIDSRTILDQNGAEKLLGSGDILFSHPSYPKPKRLQGAFMTDEETQKVCQFLRDQRIAVYDDEVVAQEVSLQCGQLLLVLLIVQIVKMIFLKKHVK